MTATMARRQEATSTLFKAVTHPLRVNILRHMLTDSGAESSPNELAKALGVPLTNVSYHVRMLKDLQLIKEVRLEQRRGALEHYYRLVSRQRVSDLMLAYHNFLGGAK